MKKIIALVFILIGTFLISASISLQIYSFTNVKEGKINVTRTIMIYMAANNLESQAAIATADIKGIDFENLKHDDINVVMLLGGSKHWFTEGISTEETSIFEATEEGLKKVQEQEVKNMGEKETLTNFINYAYENYDTDEYILLLYGHGAAIKGGMFDELQKEDFLKVKEMQEGIGESNLIKDNKKLEMVIFRSCLNGTLEVANAFKDYANYFVASEETSIGTQFNSVFSFLNNIDRNNTSEMIGKAWIDNYKKNMNEVSQICSTNSTVCGGPFKANITYSMINLSKLDKVNEYLDEFSKSLFDKTSTSVNDFLDIRKNMHQYAYTSESKYDMVDTYNFVENYEEYDRENAEKLKSAIKEAVIFNETNNDYSHGLSIYFPYNSSIFLGSVYDRVSVSNNYKNFITELAKNKNSYIEYINSSRGNSDYLYKSTKEIKNAKDYLITYENYVIYKSDNLYSKDNKTYSIFDGKLYKLNDNYIYVEEIDTKDDIYRIPAILEKENVREEVYLIIKNGVIYDVVNRTNEDVITPSMINYNLKDYNISIIIYQYVDGNLIEIVSPIDINNFYLTSTPLENELYYYIVFEIDNDLRFFGPDIISKE